MFLTLLLVTFVLAASISAGVARLFTGSLTQILRRIVSQELADAWVRYMQFAILVVGISGGVSLHNLERYVTPPSWQKDAKILEMTSDRWMLELYRTAIGSLQSIAWLLLVFFVVSLVAFVIMRFGEMKWPGKDAGAKTPTP